MWFRARLLVLVGAVLGLLAGCAADPTAPPQAEREMRRAYRWTAGLVRQTADAPAEEVPAEAAVALGYLERLRLGMGSSFRLVETALHDPRLPEEDRVRLAWALLRRTRDGEAYQVDPRALHPVDWGGSGLSVHDGPLHLALIEEAVEESDDPRGGELAVRMAYALSEAEGTLGPSALTLATRTAGLLRDRRLAREDAGALLDAAEEAGVSALQLLPSWRRERRFRVEAPLILPLGPEAEREAVRAVPRLMAQLRPTARKAPEHPAAPAREVLGPGAAARLAEEASRLDLPPQAPVAATLGAHRAYLLPTTLPERIAVERAHFLREAVNEERFAAEYARLRAAGAGGPGAAVAALAVSVALRGLAQEAVWYPGFPAPTARELRERYALASLSFDRSVPEAWRPYYLRMLDESLRDMVRVFPTLTLKGLHVRFGELQRTDALATHSPRTRTITIPPRTGAGTLAHEVAHDLDWQAARLRYGTRSAYRTDRAVRAKRDYIAAALQELAPEPLEAPPAGTVTSSAQRRPTEVFARNVDWFVAASLAREGRSNGYLSAVQDRLLTGYASAAPPDPDGRSGEAIVRILDEVAAVPDGHRRWFLERYGSGRPPSALAVVEAVLGAPLPVEAPLEPAAPHPPFGLRLSHAQGLPRTSAACASAGWQGVLGSDPLRREVAVLAARARARGLALEQARRVAGAEGREWMARQLQGRLWSPLPVDSATAELLEPLLQRVEAAERDPLLPAVLLPAPACRPLGHP